MSQKTQSYIFILSGIIVIASTVAFMLDQQIAVYPFVVGAIGMLYIKIKNLSHSADFRIRRLQKVQAASAILLLGTAYLMYTHKTAWVLTLVLSAALDLIVSYRMPKEE